MKYHKVIGLDMTALAKAKVLEVTSFWAYNSASLVRGGAVW